jgi:hypothetical protein
VHPRAAIDMRGVLIGQNSNFHEYLPWLREVTQSTEARRPCPGQAIALIPRPSEAGNNQQFCIKGRKPCQFGGKPRPGLTIPTHHRDLALKN